MMVSTTDQPDSTAKRRRRRLAEAPPIAPAAFRVEEKAPMFDLQAKQGVDGYARFLNAATPMQIVETEKHGVDSTLIKDVARRLSIPASRLFAIIGVPKATAEKKAAAGEVISGSGGLATLGLLRLLGIAQDIVASSTSADARDFDAARWLGVWLERPQPSLGGRKPADLIASPTGVEIVARLLGSLESGAYQ